MAFIPGHNPRFTVKDGQKKCAKCALWKPLPEFYQARRTPAGVPVYMGECKVCNRKRATETKIRLHGSALAYYRKKRYGLSQEDVDRLMTEQGGLCALCRKRPPQAVDHCHATNRVRGLLCMRCNSAIGVIGDTLDAAQRLVEYLQ